MIELTEAWHGVRHVVIGMLHLRALPGAPRYLDDLDEVKRSLLSDAEVLVSGGIDGLLLENFGDIPFHPRRVPAATVAHMAALAAELRRQFPATPLGINVLRNDGESALSIAHAVHAHFVRVNVLCGARVTDQGLINGIAHRLLRLRHQLNARHLKIFADVNVKHSAALAERPLLDEVEDTIERGLADALIVSGTGTGRTTDLAELRMVQGAADGRVPVFVGSGVEAENVADYCPYASGFIVGSSLKQSHRPEGPVDPTAVANLVQEVRRQSGG